MGLRSSSAVMAGPLLFSITTWHTGSCLQAYQIFCALPLCVHLPSVSESILMDLPSTFLGRGDRGRGSGCQRGEEKRAFTSVLPLHKQKLQACARLPTLMSAEPLKSVPLRLWRRGSRALKGFRPLSKGFGGFIVCLFVCLGCLFLFSLDRSDC